MIADRTKAPEAREITLPVIPQPHEIQFSNGVNCTVLDQGSQSVVVLELVFPVGRFSEPAPGLSYYVAKMLTEGTGSRNSEQIASAFDFYGSHLEITPTLDAIIIKLYTLNRFFPELAKILLELTQDSIFPEREFEIVKRIRIQQILQQHAKNNTYAGLKFRERLFGANHPYGEIITETKADSISLDAVRAFGKALQVKPEVFLAGIVTDQEIAVVSDTFGSASFNEKLEMPSFTRIKGGDEEIIREDSTQASIKYGDYTINRHHEDIHKLKICNTLFGGFFGSRLMKNIREEKGLTYGIHSSLVHLQETSYWQVSTEVLREKVDMAMAEVIREIEFLQKEPPAESELNTVINYLRGKLLTAFDTPFNTMNTIKNVKLAGLQLDYFLKYQEVLQTVTIDDISEMAAKYFNTGNSLRVIVK